MRAADFGSILPKLPRPGVCPVVVLLGGTSGSGKSTLAPLLAERLGMSTVLSTDNIRRVLRTLYTEEQCPAIWHSSYTAFECLQSKNLGFRDRLIQGYETHSDLVVGRLVPIVKQYLDKGESVLVEGVHLSVRNIFRIRDLCGPVVPFIVSVNSRNMHAERFVIRSKHMALVPEESRYFKYFDNIRAIQAYLKREAQQYHIPCVNNFRVDRCATLINGVVIQGLAAAVRHDQIALETVFREHCRSPSHRSTSKRLHQMFYSDSEREGEFSDCGSLGS